MRVALAFTGCHRRGGAERVAYECARFLAARHDVTVFANEFEGVGAGGRGAASERDGPESGRRAGASNVDRPARHYPVPMLRRPGFLRPGSFFRSSTRVVCEAAASDGAFDVLGTFGCVGPVGGVYWAQSVHAAWLDQSDLLRGRWSVRRWRQRVNLLHPMILRLERLHFRPGNYRKLIALTEQVKQDLIRFYDVPPHDVVILPNGFAPDEFGVESSRQRRAAMRETLRYRRDDRVVVFVANEIERKGLRPLMQAIARLDRPSVHLLGVGRFDAASLAGEVARLGLGERVRFTGPTSDAAAYYAAADVFALPTQYEAWGLVIVEAMATGLPVLTSRLAGAAVAVREGETGLLLDDPQSIDEIAAKLGQLLDGLPASAEQIAQSVEPYAWPHILKQYEQILTASAATDAASNANVAPRSLNCEAATKDSPRT